MRIGHGYDVHRLTPERKLILGGVDIPFSLGLLGHSDADVLSHAVMDAVLGALGQGDIGQLFPDKDDRYLGISSLKLAKEVSDLMHDHGYDIGNIDCIIIAQRPKLSAYLPQMKENLSRVFGIKNTQINIKATTEEGLGFTGTGEGIAAHCVCLLEEQKK